MLVPRYGYLALALLLAGCSAEAGGDADAYIEAARPILSPMTDAQIWEVGTGTCSRLSDNWTMENAAAAMMNSGAGAGTVLDLLDVLTEHACPQHRPKYESWLADLAAS